MVVVVVAAAAKPTAGEGGRGGRDSRSSTCIKMASHTHDILAVQCVLSYVTGVSLGSGLGVLCVWAEVIVGSLVVQWVLI